VIARYRAPRALVELGLACAALVGAGVSWSQARHTVGVAPIADGQPSTTSLVYDPQLLLLTLVLIPGLGARVNGARRWMRIGILNFQVSELAKVLVLTWVCSYCVRKRAELETTLQGLVKPVGLLTVAGVLLLIEPDFGAATVLSATGFAVLFVAGARLRYVAVLVSAAVLAFALLAQK